MHLELTPTSLKRLGLSVLKRTGAFRLLANSSWRRSRLLILCYHGISLDEEDKWRPGLYISPRTFADRLDLLHRGGYRVLPLGEAVNLLQARKLPPRSVSITFDDGFYDFYQQALPLLRHFDFPATVYLTTYYSCHNVPVFPLMCSYLLWKARDRRSRSFTGGLSLPELELRTREARSTVQAKVEDFVAQAGLSGSEKQALLEQLARSLCVNFGELLENRVLQIMNPAEVRAAAAAGIDVELHTHRHDTPSEKSAFWNEIEENRTRIEALTGTRPVHFCYPSGYIQDQFLPWLQEMQIRTATTCRLGLAEAGTNPLLLPRLLDGSQVSPVSFDAWLCGIGMLLPTRPNPTPLNARGTRPSV